VLRYFGGKTDWLANGLPGEGKLAREPRVGDLVHRDTATCRIGDRIRDVDPRDDPCVVGNESRIVMGDLRGKALNADPDTPVQQVMNLAPSTYRPNVSVKEMAHHLLDAGAHRVLVADNDGRLIGWISRDDVICTLDAQPKRT